MRKIAIIIVLMVSHFCLTGQVKNIGLPFINNYLKSEYKAGSQTWDMVQNTQGLLYFANNNGILEYDGVNWKTFSTLNQSVVRSVAMGSDNYVYAGAYNELGYLKPTQNGDLVYQSLVPLIPEEYRNFDEIWKIYQTSFGIVFQSFKYLFIYHEGKFTVIKPFSQFGFSFYINHVYYVIDKEKGILYFNRGVLTPLINQPDIFLDDEIRFILPFKGKLLVGILNRGLYILDDGKLYPWDSPVNKFLRDNHVFSGIVVSQNYFVFGTIRDGFFITDFNGNVLQHINRDKGLQNNTVLSLYADGLGNIWSGLDNGISYTETGSPATVINHCFGIETGYVSLIHNQILYLGTNQGLFAREVSKLYNTAGSDNRFTLVEGTQGQVWTLYAAGNTLLCGHNNGAFTIDGFKATRISSVRGIWKFIQRTNKPNELIAGTYTGLCVFKEEVAGNGNWRMQHVVSGFSESCKNIVEDPDGSLVISHGYKGIFRIRLNENSDTVIQTRLYNQSSGIPEKLPYEVFSLMGKPFITTSGGCYEYNPVSYQLEKSQKFNTLFAGNLSVFKLFTDSASNIWYTASNKMGVYRMLEDGNYREVSTPFYRFNSNLVPAFENIYPVNERNVLIGVQDGFIHYDPTIVKRYNDPYPVFIREVRFLKKYPDSVLSFKGNTLIGKDGNSPFLHLAYSVNSLSFKYAAPFFEEPAKTEYRCRLKGYTTEWSPWETRTMREYTNLHEGEYTFEVQARNIYKSLSYVDSYTFIVDPPFHRSTMAYIIYAVLLVSAIVANLFYFMRRIERTRQREKLLHERTLQKKEQEFQEESLIAEKKIEKLKNDKLLAEMKHKNKELANSTLHIIQKNKFLNAIKDELGEITKVASDTSKSHIRQLLRKIDRDINNEKYLKVFDTYFEDVHQDFLKRLKEQHPELSPKELRLCAYIRMNISSKEIASLLNISIRGVEVSRYRLRKKMNLEHEVNLTEYILNF